METELILCTGANAPGACMCAFTLYCFYCLSTQTLRNFEEVTDSESLREIINVPPFQWPKKQTVMSEFGRRMLESLVGSVKYFGGWSGYHYCSRCAFEQQ